MSEEKIVTELPVAEKREEKKPKVQEAKKKLRAVVDMVYRQAWEAKEKGEPVGWSSSKFPMELAETFDLRVVYPENQAAAIAAILPNPRKFKAKNGSNYIERRKKAIQRQMNLYANPQYKKEKK